MTTEKKASTPPDLPHKKQVQEELPELIKDPITLNVLLQQLLRSPQNIIYSIERGAKLPWRSLTITTLLVFALFGFILGLFSAGDQLWAAPLKITGGIAFAALLCLPSLVIFSNLCGIKCNVKVISATLMCGICMIALLLLGFIPVIWLFSNSSSSLSFFAFLVLATWIVSFLIGMRFILKTVSQLGAKSLFGIQIWFLIFALVTLQMPTTLRPIIGESNENFINLKEKKFFLIHWGETINAEERNGLKGKYEGFEGP